MKALYRTDVERHHSISCAHRLMGHAGKCKRLHGHNYNIGYVFTGPVDINHGMIVDFTTIKKVVIQEIDNLFDHKTILQIGDPFIDFFKRHYDTLSIQEYVVLMEDPPTAENMAKMIIKHVNNLIRNKPEWKFIYCVVVTVEETDGAIATCTYSGEADD